MIQRSKKGAVVSYKARVPTDEEDEVMLRWRPIPGWGVQDLVQHSRSKAIPRRDLHIAAAVRKRAVKSRP
jgi:hypothetical protein